MPIRGWTTSLALRGRPADVGAQVDVPHGSGADRLGTPFAGEGRDRVDQAGQGRSARRGSRPRAGPPRRPGRAHRRRPGFAADDRRHGGGDRVGGEPAHDPGTVDRTVAVDRA
ncbi:hypothetical protein G5V59_04420 [Nocardioides sp. W3-2-3]|nr:hypothetical protein [Nocardioides convexus]